MGRSKALILATLVAAGASSAAFGADLLPPPPQLGPPPPMDVGGGWYLRGDVGVGAVQMSNWRSTLQPFDETGQSLRQRRATVPSRFRRHGRHRPSPASASAISSTTGSARTSPANIGRKRPTGPTSCRPGPSTIRPLLAQTHTPAASAPLCSWRTAISISAPGIASRPLSAAVSASPPINWRG